MTKREKTMLYIVFLLLAALVMKSLFLDGAKVTGDELKFKQFVERTIEEEKEYNGFLKRYGVANYKVVSIKKTNEEGTSNVIVCDEKGKICTTIEIQGAYIAKVRAYIFHVIPYTEFKVKSDWSKK